MSADDTTSSASRQHYIDTGKWLPTDETAQIEPEVDRHLEAVIRDLRAAEADWLPKHRETLAAHREWTRLSVVSNEARDRCWALRKEAEQYLKSVGPR